jgi:hypothetical protein
MMAWQNSSSPKNQRWSQQKLIKNDLLPVEAKGRFIMASTETVEHFLTVEDGVDEKSTNDNSTSVDTNNYGYGEARDEIKEVQNISRTETRLIRTWRIILLALLAITAAAVSSVTYVLLRQEEYVAFEVSVRALFRWNGTAYFSTMADHNLLNRV